MKIVNVHEAKTHLSRLLDEARAGEEIIVAKNGQPYVRLTPIGPNDGRILGFLPGYVDDDFFHELPENELAEWQ